MKLSEKIQEALREQQEINLSDPAVQKRLAAQWGYVPAGAQPAPNAVAYLDLGAGGYMDIGTDLTDEELGAIPKGRHMLGIVGTYGVEGYVPAQPAPSVPEDVMRDAERYRYLRARDDGTAGVGCWIEADGRACDRGWLCGVQLDSAIDSFIEVLAAAPKPEGK